MFKQCDISDTCTFFVQHTSPPVSLLGQLLWREFYYCVAVDTPNFDKMEGNPVCKQIPWDTNESYLKAWKEVCTNKSKRILIHLDKTQDSVLQVTEWSKSESDGKICVIFERKYNTNYLEYFTLFVSYCTVIVTFKGRTGYPFIDAVMTQLRQEGWIHHLARHSVACFLTRGDLWINWEEGMKVHLLVRTCVTKRKCGFLDV